jgi:hypothetical protein
LLTPETGKMVRDIACEALQFAYSSVEKGRTATDAATTGGYGEMKSVTIEQIEIRAHALARR